MAYSDPDIAAFQSAGEMNLAKQQLGQQRLAQLAEESQFYEQIQYKKQLDEEARRQKEKEEYAKWEKEQILNQVASQLFKDKSANGEFGRMLSPAQQMMEAAKEAARRGQGGYAQEFLAQGQQLAAKEQQAALAAEETRLKNEKTRQEAEKLRREGEALSRDSGKPELVDVKRADDIFKEYTGEARKSLDGIVIAKNLAATAGENPQTSEQLNTAIANIFQGGRLSSEDLKLVRNAGSFPERVGSALTNFLEGTATQVSIEDKVALLDALEKVEAEKYNKGVSKATSLLRKTKGLSEDILSEYEARKYSLPEALKKDTGGAITPTSQAEFEAIPRGTKFVNPADGKTYIKN